MREYEVERDRETERQRYTETYWVATVSRLLKIIRLFCKIAL